MKILHITTIVEWRGGDAQMLTTYNLMKDYTDIEQFILCPEGSVLSEKLQDSDVPYFTASRKSKQSLKFLKKIKEIVKKEAIDIIHVHDSNAFSLTLLMINSFPKVKLVYSRKRNNPISKNFFKRLKYNHKRIDRIVCVSDAVKDVFKDILKKTSHLETIYDGIDVKNFENREKKDILKKEYKLDSETTVIANIASLTEQKDIYTFIDAAKIISDNYDGPLQFFVIGGGELHDELSDYKKKVGLESKIIFTGFRSDIADILPEIDILLMSSIIEGLPLSIFEAFAAKVPVVSTSAGGINEAIVQEKTGMISPIKDAKALAENTLTLLRDDNLKNKITNNANILVNEKFTLEVMKNNYHKMYQSVYNS
ncbi:glycosyltransferase family 4 protein [Galbibacter mesophilus]|uniref:glycosyltransferase family 4 protein n=1 Tax=Galbibacter mesophilus TaxID=379069 RepID=UPI00191D0F63|nr:glycosyltransferase family 4 protein [Galbibacter mesophilus]MCM5663505.1 glycosyltransferase family 4 protein [Galbibacter mesophilus]